MRGRPVGARLAAALLLRVDHRVHLAQQYAHVRDDADVNGLDLADLARVDVDVDDRRVLRELLDLPMFCMINILYTHVAVTPQWLRTTNPTRTARPVHRFL